MDCNSSGEMAPIHQDLKQFFLLPNEYKYNKVNLRTFWILLLQVARKPSKGKEDPLSQHKAGEIAQIKENSKNLSESSSEKH